jgi:hypothetical protein
VAAAAMMMVFAAVMAFRMIGTCAVTASAVGVSVFHGSDIDLDIS